MWGKHDTVEVAKAAKASLNDIFRCFLGRCSKELISRVVVITVITHCSQPKNGVKRSWMKVSHPIHFERKVVE